MVLVGCGGPAESRSAAHGVDPAQDRVSVHAISLYRVAVELCGGADVQRATAVAVDDDLVATVAHSLVGAKRVTVRSVDQRDIGATVVYLDADRDIALLRIDEPSARVAVLGPPAESGARVTIASFAEETGPTDKAAVIVDLVEATLDGRGRRAAIELDAAIEPGDSGAPVLDDRNRMVGMVFATARDEPTGWAVAALEIESALEELDRSGPGEIPPAC